MLQVLPSLVMGGVERSTVEIAGGLTAAGWRALVASSGGPMVREIERAGARHFTLPLADKSPLALLRNAGTLANLVSLEGVDLVHARSRAPAWSAWMAARRRDLPFVTTFHGTYGLGLPGKRWYNSVMTRGRRVIVASRFIADHVRRHYGVGDDRLRLIPRGVDLAMFDPARVSPERMIQLARSWRLPDGVPVVMLPGRLTRWKGQLVLIDALSHFRHRDFRCVLVGSDQGRTGYRREIERRVEARGLAAKVQIVDDCRDMPAAYMLSDVVVSASTDPEAFGRVAIEAQAMGRPIVATRLGAAPETVIEHETGLLVAPGDANALARALEDALALDADQREQLAGRAIAHVRANFTRDLMCARTLDVYCEVLNEAGWRG